MSLLFCPVDQWVQCDSHVILSIHPFFLVSAIQISTLAERMLMTTHVHKTVL